MDDIMNAELTDILQQRDIIISPSGGGGLQSIAPGLYQFTMPDGEIVTIDEFGNIIE